MTWTASKIFYATIVDAMNGTAPYDLNSDAFKVALYNDTPTPDQTAASASTAYGTGQFATANEVYQAVQWPQAGKALVNVTAAMSSNVYKFDADDLSSGTAATLANVYGCLVYDDQLTTPVADQGLCYIYFGGGQSVTGGTLTIQWNTSGILTITL